MHVYFVVLFKDEALAVLHLPVLDATCDHMKLEILYDISWSDMATGNIYYLLILSQSNYPKSLSCYCSWLKVYEMLLLSIRTRRMGVKRIEL